jgi:hypothetical protein
MIRSFSRNTTFVFCLLAISTFAQKKEASSEPLLPKSFAGWQQTANESSRDPAKSDPANAPLLKELSFTDEERAEYRWNDRVIHVSAVRFADAGGALGAFDFYRPAEALKEDVGDEAASLPNLTVLFRRSNLLVQVKLDQVTAMTAAQIRELASALPQAQGEAANLPQVQSFLPKDGQVKNSARYFVGPLGLDKAGDSALAPLIDFSRSPEFSSARYDFHGKQEELLVISYPTPKIATERERALQAAATTQQPPLFVRRSGPLIAIARGEWTDRQAGSLIGAVNYDANITWTERTDLATPENIGFVVLASFLLVGTLLLIALVTGFGFHGIRILLQRLLPSRRFQHAEDATIIRLRIEP